MPSVAKRSPKPHLSHVDAHLSTILEADTDMTGEAADFGIDTDAGSAAAAASGEAETNNVAEIRLSLPEDVQSAEAFQVGVHWRPLVVLKHTMFNTFFPSRDTVLTLHGMLHVLHILFVTPWAQS